MYNSDQIADWFIAYNIALSDCRCINIRFLLKLSM